MVIKISELENLGNKALAKYGYTPDESKIILGMMMYAQLRGNNQGIVKLIGRGYPKNPQAGEFIIEKETKLSARINGNKQAGALVMQKALDVAVAKAKGHGFGIVGTNNTNTSTGALGYWAKQIADSGLIGFVFAGSPPTVAMYGSYEAIFGTNPMAIGIPGDSDPFVLDFATAAMAYYGLIEAKTAGRKIPGDIAYDKEGNLTDDPAKAMDGALIPFGNSYKSAGLSMAVQILTGPLVGAAFVGIGDTAGNWGNLIFAIDPELMMDKSELKKNVQALMDKVKTVKPLPGVKEVMLPSERGNRLMKQRLAKGEIDIEENLYNELVKVAG